MGGFVKRASLGVGSTVGTLAFGSIVDGTLGSGTFGLDSTIDGALEIGLNGVAPIVVGVVDVSPFEVVDVISVASFEVGSVAFRSRGCSVRVDSVETCTRAARRASSLSASTYQIRSAASDDVAIRVRVASSASTSAKMIRRASSFSCAIDKLASNHNVPANERKNNLRTEATIGGDDPR